MTIRTLIVDDEPLARRGLELRLQDAADITIVRQCANGREAIAAIAEEAPDLMFLDIQMPGLSGLEVVAQVPQESMPMVVFVTAFDRYAINAFEAHALDYLLKPVDDTRLAAALDRVRAQWQQQQAIAQREQLMALLADVKGNGEISPESAAAPVLPVRRRASLREDAADPVGPRDDPSRRDHHRLDRRRGRLHVPARGRPDARAARHDEGARGNARSAGIPARAPLHDRQPRPRALAATASQWRMLPQAAVRAGSEVEPQLPRQGGDAARPVRLGAARPPRRNRKQGTLTYFRNR